MDNLKHVQVPSKTHNLNNIDLIVYAVLKSYKIKSNPCFPSQDTIAAKLKITRPTVKKSIDRLEQEGYITITHKGKFSLYSFSEYKQFEVFSDEFLFELDLNSKIKGYIIGTQQGLFKDIKGLGKTTMSTSELASNINVSDNTIRSYDRELIDKGYLTMVKTNARDSLTGLCKTERIFDLEKLGQAIVWKLKEHDDKINQNSEDIEVLKQDNIALKRQLDIILRSQRPEKKKGFTL